MGAIWYPPNHNPNPLHNPDPPPNPPLHPTNISSNPTPPNSPHPYKSQITPSKSTLSLMAIFQKMAQYLQEKETKSPPLTKVVQYPQVIHPPSSHPNQEEPQSPKINGSTIPSLTQVEESISFSVIQSPQPQTYQDLVPKNDIINFSPSQDKNIPPSHDIIPSQNPSPSSTPSHNPLPSHNTIIPPNPFQDTIPHQYTNIPFIQCKDSPPC